MNGRTLLAALLACLVAFAAPAAPPAADGPAATPLAGTVAGPQQDSAPAQALIALEAERVEAIAAFDWGQRADYGARLLAYNRLLQDFDLRELALRADVLDELGRPEEAARLRAERDDKPTTAPSQAQVVPHAAPTGAEEETR